MSSADERLIVVGRLIGPHGVRGELKVQSFCEPPERLFRYKPLYIGDDANVSEFVAKKLGVFASGFIVSSPQITDRDAALRAAGTKLKAKRSQFPKLKTDEYYWSDLIGLDVFNTEDVRLGTVDSLIETGANDVLVVNDDERERLIPYTPTLHVLVIDLENRRITVDWDADF
jgi:16S rRNA processing protein RimM